MTLDNHWLKEARACPSPFYNERPHQEISLLVIHNIALPPKTYGGRAIEQLFTGCLSPEEHPYFAEIAHLEVSAHLLITRTGELVQFVGFDRRAWHAGQSSFQGRENCNDFALGIEMEGSDDQPYTPIQYLQLQRVTRQLMQAYPAITRDRICGHSTLAPGRKTDPGPAFDWDAYLTEL
ncbi:1,6-anhydro-N-acetylmuramyl-L-alanine amidase AmpD [Marinospirillum perlucidum]|uniref:1,6-anhydro-N-acetylmuramyl-L-alanine amidase AmpD n=1 Tax=Marinospirillum perlucidum TaxID=1982602 RepID=UPI000DF2BC30|nr:1,6-anhydro-N-acetylmuramyl-L-alanine amidase AmpD [Marinospirillum perlucidum]